MRTYRALARAPLADWYNDDPQLAGYTIYEAEGSPRDTGILDQHGTPIYAVIEREPIGFNRR